MCNSQLQHNNVSAIRKKNLLYMYVGWWSGGPEQLMAVFILGPVVHVQREGS